MAAPLVSNAESKHDGAAMDESDVHRQIYFVIDTTASMSAYIRSLSQVLEQIFRMIRILFAGEVRLHIISFKDYCDRKIIEECHDNDTIQQWVVRHLRPSGGGDAPEAAKTALNVLFEYITRNDPKRGRQSIVLVYTDAPPHHQYTGSSNLCKEREAIESKTPGFDWVEICRSFHVMGVPFITFLDRNISKSTRSFWQMLGEVVLLPRTSSDHITKATVGALNQLMDATDENFAGKYAADYTLSRYCDADALRFDAISTEDDCHGLLPSSILPEDFRLRLKAVDFLQLQPLPFLSSVLRDLPKKLNTDESFRNLVFAEFAHIMTEQNVLCLSYNAVFGAIWRGLCRFRKDERLKVLRDTFSSLITKLDEKRRTEMQQWVDESYDETEEINAIVREHMASVDDEEGKQDETEWITLDAIDAIPVESLPTKKELLTIATSLFGDIITKMQSVMTHLVRINVASKDREATVFDSKAIASFIAIPSTLDDRKLFSLLSHLVIPGTMFSLRPSLIMAMIAYLSGNVTLKDRAERLLLSLKGKWIALDDLESFPEFLSVPFVKLVTRCDRAMHGQLLSVRETAFYHRLYRVYRVRSARPKEFELAIGFAPKLTESRPDFKRKCVDCKHWRSFTIMTEGDRCGKCVAQWIDANGDAMPVIPDQDLDDESKRSHLVSCSSCKAIYAVSDTKRLNVRPKCHFCRSLGQCPAAKTIECRRCLNRWVLSNPKFFASGQGGAGWLCPCCTERGGDEPELHRVPVTFEALCSQFPAILSGLFEIECGALAVSDLFSSMSLYKLYMKHTEALFAENEERKEPEEEDKVQRVVDALSRHCPAKHDGRCIHGIEGVVQLVAEQILKGELADICCLCFETKALLVLESPCGRCRNRMCSECLTAWYQQLQPGHIVLPSHLLCPFCKQRPRPKTLKKYNRESMAIVRSKVALSTRWYHGWCRDCYRVQQAVPRECLRETVPNLTRFRCEECRERAAERECGGDADFVRKHSKDCPGCNAPTVKASGCNHITCRCGAHWCYECGELHSADTIYEHMEEAHGGIYNE